MLANPAQECAEAAIWLADFDQGGELGLAARTAMEYYQLLCRALGNWFSQVLANQRQ